MCELGIKLDRCTFKKGFGYGKKTDFTKLLSFCTQFAIAYFSTVYLCADDLSCDKPKVNIKSIPLL